jgi:hypothetical protein
MSLSKHGTVISDYQITNIERFGFWIYTNEEEYFVKFEEFPDFKHARIEEILNFKRIDPQQFHWPDLDIDIDINSLKNPSGYPLGYKKI